MKHIVIFSLLSDPEVIPVADNFDRWEELANGNPYAESTEDLPSEITLPELLDVKTEDGKVTFSWQGFQVEHKGYFYPVIVEYFNKNVRSRQIIGLRCKYKVWAEIATLWLVNQMLFMREDSVERWKTRVIDV
jgi:hypothetical protein